MENKEIIKWWEGKRMIYNLILIGFAIFVIVWDYRYHSSIGTSIDYDIGEKVGTSIFYISMANVFYCLGTGFEFTCKYYEQDFSNSGRYFLYVLGILYSIIIITITISPVTI